MIGQEKHVHTPQRTQVLKNSRNLNVDPIVVTNTMHSFSVGSKPNSSEKDKGPESLIATLKVP